MEPKVIVFTIGSLDLPQSNKTADKKIKLEKKMLLITTENDAMKSPRQAFAI
jgi:hypothetical protein